MGKLSQTLLVAGALSLAAVPAASAVPSPESPSPVGGPGAHPHHVHTGQGCRNLNAPPMEPGSRGLHRASNETGPERGPFHGTCEEPHPHLPPGGHG